MIPTLLLITSISISVPANASNWDLAESLAKARSAPVLLYVDVHRRWEKTERVFDSQEGFENVIGNRYQVKWTTDGAAYSSGPYSEDVAFVNHGGGFDTEVQPKVKFEPGYDLSKPFTMEADTYLYPEQFESLLPGWEVKWNWFFKHRGRFVFRNPKGMTADQLIQLTAKAVGGDARISGKTVEFVPNIKEFRRREKGAIVNKLGTLSVPWQISDWRFFEATLEAATNNQLQVVFDDENQRVRIPCPSGSRLRLLLDRRIEARSQMEPPSEGEQFKGWMRDLVDLSAPAYAVLWRGMIPTAQLTGRAKNHSLVF